MIRTYASTRCLAGRTMRRDPQPDDPSLETDIGQCEECDGDGCGDLEAATCNDSLQDELPDGCPACGALPCDWVNDPTIKQNLTVAPSNPERAPAEFPSDRAPSCECHTKLNAKLAEFNTGLTFNLFGGFRAILATYKLVSKVRGNAVTMIANYCPFCGVKYPEDRS